MTHRRLTKRGERHASARPAALLLISLHGLACADAALSDVLGGDEVSLGAASPRVDLVRCRNADCKPEKTERQALPGEEQPCDPGPAEELHPVRFRALVGAVACPDAPPGATCTTSDGVSGVGCDDLSQCTATATDLALAPDEKVWISVEVNGIDPKTDRPASGVWIVHESNDGSARSARMLAFENRPAPSVATLGAHLWVDERGHAFVLLRRALSDETQDYLAVTQGAVEYELIELDESGRELGSRIPIKIRGNMGVRFPPEAQLIVAGMGPELILGETRFASGSIARLDLGSRTLRWVQTREQRLAIGDLVSDASGEVTILTRSPNGALSGRIERYTTSGQLAWERTWREVDPSSSSIGGNLTIDAAGVVRIAENTGITTAIVHRIAADGTSHSSTLLSLSEQQGGSGTSSGDPAAFSWLTSQDTLLISVGNLTPEGAPEVAYLYELSEDATACRLYTLSAPPGVFGRGRVDAARQLHFITEQGYGVLQLPEAP